ncbi:MAG: LuxR C-terminal-related transcriptional regulator [Candidatus Sulfotelmatobacter sp.]
MPSAPARPGMIVVDSSLRVVASNAEVLRIFTFPERPEKISNLDAWLAKKVRTSLSESHSSFGLSGKVQSARRTYVCRSFPLDVGAIQANGSGQSGGLAIVMIERKSNGSATIAEISERFGLTAREQETVQFLRQGFTSKEIAQRMKISPNTVKAFIRLVMVKMGVSTRSGIIGKVVCPDSQAAAARPLPEVSPAAPRKLRAFAGEVQNRI